ncbi:hypothetical protein VOLCADRAFT_97362 [Volvox carteri f. nagariensis]|uniref:Anticodon-binding domain-containing protein n=1 Tax=Volvox carteri f. nagariensis TaxID=3068 RepID=D8UCJ7_VOLCA|nr:uncharacterized protein VOLCADRAFT_97362 [Volvox carteri f. nagariensis]EFJ42504.1 hypothetical protein VOLCADRAFT_97362 [Volvox carteri f. nagariensis]|eukprot:XP_002956360.1 hypothetical protein VOLCADRAFT_97362 [Volvox carteri f. nagariensis]
MGGDELRGLSFLTRTGETVRLHDCICWRHLEGRPCRTAQDCQVAQSVDVVIIPVPPSGYSNSKRARKCGVPTQAANPTTSTAAPSAAIIKTAREALEAGGLRVTVDDCPRQTPGAKFHTWEHRGVALRVEVGVREVATGTTCLALHPRLAHMMPLANRTAGLVAQPPPSDHDGALEGSAPGSPPGGVSSVAAAAAAVGDGCGRGGRSASLRLGALSPEALVATCRAVVAAERSNQNVGTSAHATAPIAAAVEPPSVASGCSSNGSGAMTMAAAVGGSPRSQWWCRKLHLWPELLATTWGGDTAVLVAAMLAELTAAATAANAVQQADCDGSGAGGAGAAGDLQAGATEPGPGQRPCVAHLRHLLQLGRRCYCGRGHYSLLQLQQEVERRFIGNCDHHHQQQQQALALTWIAPPSLPPGHAGSRRQQKGAGSAAGGRERHHHQQQQQERQKPTEPVSLGPLTAHEPPPPSSHPPLAVSRTRQGGSHGWARVFLAAPSSPPSPPSCGPGAAVAALDGRLRLGGAALTVSYSSGRLDTIFPYLPYTVRSAMRVDSTAAFSATDQATADKMTDVLAGLAERLLLPSPLSPSSPPLLLPLTLTDGTACCGGNTLSFARRFQRVVAVELDPDRAADLRHNTALVQAWDAFRRGQHPAAAAAAARPPTEAAEGPSGDQVRQLPGVTDPAGVSAPPPPGVRCVTATAPGPPAGGALPSRPLGVIEVLWGDYSRAAKSLRQDVVFLDPPWGGQKPLSYLVTELLVGGSAGMVALKLPSRLCGELRSMQWRVRQLVAARLREAGDGARGDDDDDDGVGGPDAVTAPPAGRLLCGAEVTLGRSALVVFLLVPYRRTYLVHEDRGEVALAMQPEGADGDGRGQAGGGDGGEEATEGGSAPDGGCCMTERVPVFHSRFTGTRLEQLADCTDMVT